MGILGGVSGKESTCQCRDMGEVGSSLGKEDALEEGLATHSTILAWRTVWIEEPGELQPMGPQRVRHH